MSVKLEIKIITRHDNLIPLLKKIIQDIKTDHYMENKWHEIKESEKDYPSTAIYNLKLLEGI